MKLQYFGYLMERADSLEKIWGKIEGRKRVGITDNEMVGLQNQLNRHELEQALGGGEGQGSLVCCSLRGCKKSDMI